MRSQKRDHRIGGFGSNICWEKRNLRGTELIELGCMCVCHTHTRSLAQSTWCHCYVALPSITPIFIIGFCIVWPRQIKVRRCIVDCKSACAHCFLISVQHLALFTYAAACAFLLIDFCIALNALFLLSRPKKNHILHNTVYVQKTQHCIFNGLTLTLTLYAKHFDYSQQRAQDIYVLYKAHCILCCLPTTF